MNVFCLETACFLREKKTETLITLVDWGLRLLNKNDAQHTLYSNQTLFLSYEETKRRRRSSFLKYLISQIQGVPKTVSVELCIFVPCVPFCTFGTFCTFLYYLVVDCCTFLYLFNTFSVPLYTFVYLFVLFCILLYLFVSFCTLLSLFRTQLS